MSGSLDEAIVGVYLAWTSRHEHQRQKHGNSSEATLKEVLKNGS